MNITISYHGNNKIVNKWVADYSAAKMLRLSNKAIKSIVDRFGNKI